MMKITTYLLFLRISSTIILSFAASFYPYTVTSCFDMYSEFGSRNQIEAFAENEFTSAHRFATYIHKPDHAYRMAKFAVNCQAKTTSILHQLKDSLGDDTASLTCRIGMHSGPGKWIVSFRFNFILRRKSFGFSPHLSSCLFV